MKNTKIFLVDYRREESIKIWKRI